MKNGLSEPQTILLLGGTSDIGTAIVDELASDATHTIVLACRNTGDAPLERFGRPGRTVVATEFDAADTPSHPAIIADVAAAHGDIDVVIVAFGVLGSQEEFESDPVAAAHAVQVNFSGAVSVTLAAAAQMKAQGHGHIVVLSSVAGERVRASNFVYGASKAGLDGFAQGLNDSLSGSGVQVTVVRPGFVESAMTEGLKPAPFATTPEAVALATVAGMRSGKHTVWTPGILRFVFMALRHVPRPIFRRLPLG